MATLVLGAVGTLVGGPIGGAIGSLLGNLVDRAVLGPKRQLGPRLGDLSLQTSSYGSQIPKLFGTMRIAGTVIWATNLRESTHSSGGGKAGGSSTSYSYSASFAVALSARPILSVVRIWADGNLLRSASGEWKADTGFRLYTGTEDQPIDPLIASAEGIGATPAHRGLAYAVFENLQLADFGNRIPSLSFEVTADPTDVTVSSIAAVLTGGTLAGEGGVTLGGFAASGEGVRDALSSLVEAVPLSLDDDGTILRINSEAMAAIDPAWAGADPDGGRQPTRVRERQAAAVLPDAIALRYYEPVRDYQTGLQRARRDGVGRRETALDLPAAIEADAARALAEAALSRAWVERDKATLRLPWAALPIRAGTLATLADGSRWRVASATLERMALEVTLRRQGGGVLPATGADPGRAVASPDASAGRTVPLLVDLPMLDDTLAAAPRLWLAAAGTGAGWRRAAVSLSLDGGASWRDAGGTALPATIGHAVTALGAGAPDRFDGLNSVEVELLHGAMALVGTDDIGLVKGGNLALLGAELLQFGSAVQLSATRWRLSRLVRGRRGTEWAIAGHVAGEPFLMINAATLLPLDVPLAAIGTTATVSLIGPGDAGTAAVTSLPITGAAVRPPAPVHVTAVKQADGGIRLDWVRRSRLGWPWLDGGDVPLGEDGERYRLELQAVGATARTVELNTPFFLYSTGDQAADGAAHAPALTATLAMLGTSAASLPPATFTWTW